ncbi:MAG: hypothetical protein LBL31_00865 [Spirochaetaceae bacterium]|nr:hypothetical protein [Spirochaetaceae bacterium]
MDKRKWSMAGIPSWDAQAQTGGFAPIDTIADYYSFAKQSCGGFRYLDRGASPVAPETGLRERKNSASFHAVRRKLQEG